MKIKRTGRYVDGRQMAGSRRLGYVSQAMAARMDAYCEAFAISGQELVIRALDAYLLEWEEEITIEPPIPEWDVEED